MCTKQENDQAPDRVDSHGSHGYRTPMDTSWDLSVHLRLINSSSATICGCVAEEKAAQAAVQRS